MATLFPKLSDAQRIAFMVIFFIVIMALFAAGIIFEPFRPSDAASLPTTLSELFGEFNKVYEGLLTRGLPITVDYSKTLKKMIHDGAYDWVDSRVNTSNFPIENGQSKVVVTIKLVPLGKLGKIGTSQEIIEKLRKVRLRPAIPHELLAFGSEPSLQNMQRKYSIVALGSPSENGFVLFLWGWSDERRLDVEKFQNTWNGDYLFAAVSIEP